jgi:hypothetical protein
MSDKAILFSAPMVRALLDGRKQQTRRVLKPQPPEWAESVGWSALTPQSHVGYRGTRPDGRFAENSIRLRFAKGDRLWVKETWRTEARHDAIKPAEIPRDALVSFDADYLQEPNDGCRGRTRVSIHMPRWASRLTLTVTDVRVQRLQEITPADAIAEGIPAPANSMTIDCETCDPRDDFQALWNSINGADSWAANPWIVALTFTVERRNIDAARAA